MAESKTELVAAKKSGWLSGLQGLASFATNAYTQYQTAKAPPPTTTPAPTMLAPSSSTSGGVSKTSLLVIGGAVAVGLLVLRRR